jgi:regulator of replication initiation timing
MTDDQKKLMLEQQLNKLVQQVAELNRRVQFLERENNRRKMETNQITSAINRKG